jgi:rhamnosyltransferase
MSNPEQPHVAVLLATWNGLRWLPEQLDTILAQRDVRVRVIALDDGSTDGTRDWLVDRAATEPRLQVLPELEPSGSSAANFLRLLRMADLEPDELVAFADQDDLWHPGKLARHAAILAGGQVDGVSSSIMSFDADGRRTLIRKDYPQRDFDYLLESPGPGCTFLVTPRLVELVREVLAADDGTAGAVDFHDSLVYAIARARGWRWHIDGEPTVDYRQHDANVMGSNSGGRAAVTRLALIRSHWHRRHAITLTTVSSRVAPSETGPALERILALLTTKGLRARMALARLSGQLRRRPRDRRIIGLLIATGVW